MKNTSDHILRVSELSNTKQKILFVTRDAILSGGISALEFKDIAVKSGISRATLYRHFASLSDLIYALLDIEGRFLVAPYYDPKRRGFTGSGREKFEKTLMQIQDASQRFPEFFRLLAIADAQFGSDLSSETYAKIFQDMFAQLFVAAEPVNFLVEGQTDGTIRAGIDPELSANAAIAAVVSTVLALQVNPAGLKIIHAGYSGDEILREVIRAQCYGLA